jgi:hypothetical protein
MDNRLPTVEEAPLLQSKNMNGFSPCNHLPDGASPRMISWLFLD